MNDMNMNQQLLFVEELIKIALKYKVESISTENTSIKLTTESYAQDKPQVDNASLLTAPQMPSDNDMLFWSSEGDMPSDDLTAQSEQYKDLK